MPTWRKLHTKTVESFDVNDMPDDFTRLLWVLLPTKLCQFGRGPGSPAWVRSSVFPMREDVTLDMINDAMNWYANRGMIKHYEVNGREYFHIPTWRTYQGDTTREADSIYPAPPSSQAVEPETDPGATPEAIAPDLPPPAASATPESVTTNARPMHDPCATGSSTEVEADAATDAEVDSISSPQTPRADADYQQIRQFWIDQFPDKPKPREDNATLRGKASTRMRAEHFQENWRASLIRASKSAFLAESNWFTLGWFLKNDNHYEKCLNGNYDDQKQGRGKPGPLNAMEVYAQVAKEEGWDDDDP